MNDARRIVATPRGALVLRPAQAEDEPFQFGVFAANNIGVLRLANIPEAMTQSLLDFQFRSRTTTYRTLFPQAVNSIIEANGAAIGCLIENDESDAMHIVEIEFLPEHQRQGLGTALVRALRDQWGARGLGARAKVFIGNEPSLKMFGKLGFVQRAPDANAYVELLWSPPASPPRT